MKITLNLENVDELAKLKTYAEEKGYTIDQLIDGIIKKASTKINQCQPEDAFNSKLDAYFINDFLQQTSLKFKYGISKDATVKCFQFGKEKDLKYSIDASTGEIFIYVLKKGAPNKGTLNDLRPFTLKLNLELLYNKIFGPGTFQKYAMQTVTRKIQKSQEEWKKKKGAKK